MSKIKSCIMTDIPQFYREVELPYGFKATIRHLVPSDFDIIKRKSKYKVIDYKMVDEEIETITEADTHAQLNWMLLLSLSPKNNKTFENGGCGWDLTGADGKVIDISIDNVDALLPEIRKELDAAVAEITNDWFDDEKKKQYLKT